MTKDTRLTRGDLDLSEPIEEGEDWRSDDLRHYRSASGAVTITPGGIDIPVLESTGCFVWSNPPLSWRFEIMTPEGNQSGVALNPVADGDCSTPAFRTSGLDTKPQLVTRRVPVRLRSNLGSLLSKPVLGRVSMATLLTLLVSCGAGPQTASVVEAPPVAAEVQLSRERPLALWEVSREGLEASWLFGTCHTGVLLEEALPESRRVLVEQASLFVMEVDSATLDVNVIRQQLMLPEGQTMETILGPETWRELTEQIELAPEAAEALNQMHPFALYGMVVNQMASQDGEVSQEGFVPMDFVLSELASANEVESAFLETMDEQMALFLGIEMAFWTRGIDTLISPEGRQEMRDTMGQALDICRTGDPSNFLEANEDLEGSAREFNERLINERNENWIAPLETYFQQGGVFVAVGGAHLVGDASVVALLQARGWTVEQQTGITVDRHTSSDVP
jgi:uncharacterized protein YbaP (TraB family)